MTPAKPKTVTSPSENCSIKPFSYMNNDQIENKEKFNITYGSNLKLGYINIFKLTKYEGAPERIEDHFELITSYKRPKGVHPISNPDGAIPSVPGKIPRSSETDGEDDFDLTWFIILLILLCLAAICFYIYKALLRKKRKVKKLPKIDAFTEEAIVEVRENDKKEELLRREKTLNYGLNDSTMDDSLYMETRESADSLPRN